MPLELIIRHWLTRQTTEHKVEPSEPVTSLISNLIGYWGISSSPNDPISLSTGDCQLLDSSQSFIQTGLKNGDELVLGPRSFLVSRTGPLVTPAPPPVSSMTLRLREHDGRWLRLHSTDAKRMGVDDGDLLRLRDEISGTFAAGQVETDPEVPAGHVEVDPMTIDCLGASPDQEIVADRYPAETLKSLTNITLGVKTTGGDADEGFLIKVRERESELARLINRRVVVRGQKFRWAEMNLVAQVLETEPALSGDEVGLVSTDVLRGFSYRLLTDEVSFDGILLIDMSFSMEKDDLEVKSIQHALSYMASAMTGPFTRTFLQRFQEGARVERHQGAILASLMYLAGKVSRGKGERISVVLFSDSPQTIIFDGEQFFDASVKGKDVNALAETIVSSVDRMRKRSTRMAPALTNALEIARRFDPRKPKMLVMLTDGRPDDAELAEKVVYQAIAPRMDMILFIAGIGEEVDQGLMDRWTKATGGEFLQVRDLNELAEWYGSLSKKLTFKASADSMKSGNDR